MEDQGTTVKEALSCGRNNMGSRATNPTSHVASPLHITTGLPLGLLPGAVLFPCLPQVQILLCSGLDF